MIIYIVVWFVAFVFSLLIGATQLLSQGEAFLVVHTISICVLFFWLAWKYINIIDNSDNNCKDKEKFKKNIKLSLNFMFTIFTILMIYLMTFISYFLLSFIIKIEFSITYEFISFISFLIFFNFPKKDNPKETIIK